MNLRELREINSIHPHRQADIVFVRNSTRETFNAVELESIKTFDANHSTAAFPMDNSPYGGRTTLDELVYTLDRHVGTNWFSFDRHNRYNPNTQAQQFTVETELAMVNDDRPFNGLIVAWFYHKETNEMMFFVS